MFRHFFAIYKNRLFSLILLFLLVSPAHMIFAAYSAVPVMPKASSLHEFNSSETTPKGRDTRLKRAGSSSVGTTHTRSSDYLDGSGRASVGLSDDREGDRRDETYDDDVEMQRLTHGVNEMNIFSPSNNDDGSCEREAEAPVRQMEASVEEYAEAQDCPICFDPVTEGQEHAGNVLLLCPHGPIIHGRCMQEWIQRSSFANCPICRKDSSASPSKASNGAPLSQRDRLDEFIRIREEMALRVFEERAARKKLSYTWGLLRALIMDCSEEGIQTILAYLKQHVREHEGRSPINIIIAGVRRTPLHYAVARGLISVVEQLLTFPGIKLNVIDAYGFTPLDLAIAHRNDEIIEILRSHGAITSVQLSNSRPNYVFVTHQVPATQRPRVVLFKDIVDGYEHDSYINAMREQINADLAPDVRAKKFRDAFNDKLAAVKRVRNHIDSTYSDITGWFSSKPSPEKLSRIIREFRLSNGASFDQVKKELKDRKNEYKKKCDRLKMIIKELEKKYGGSCAACCW